MADSLVVEPRVLGRMSPIIEAVLKLYSIKHEALVQPGKSVRAITEARDVCCWLAKELKLPLTDDEIAASLNKGGSVTKVAVRRTNKLRLRDRWLRESTDQLLAELSA